MCPEDSPRFIVDFNAGKLARWLRMIGYDTQLFDRRDDKYLIHIALIENRIILTRDTQMMQRRIITIGELKALLIKVMNPAKQIHQVIKELGLNPNFQSLQFMSGMQPTAGKDKQRKCQRPSTSLCLSEPITVCGMPELPPPLLAGYPLAGDGEKTGRTDK